MDIKIEIIIAIKLIVAFLLGAFIGYDREKHGNSAGIRTYAAVCMGAAIFTSIGTHMINDTAAASRIIANIITGVGFLGAGIIYRNSSGNGSHGLTTAATLWCTAAVGVAVGLNMYIISAIASLALYFLLSLHHRTWYVEWKKKIKYPDDKENTELHKSAEN